MRIGALEAGGTKMVCAVGNEKGEIFEQTSIPTGTPQDTVPALVNYFKEREVEALGIGCFGPVCLDRTSEKYGYITSTPKLAWRDYDIAGVMKEQLGCPVGFDTDVNGSVLGEVTFGCAKGLRNVLYLTVGTGIGAGIWSEGRLLHGNLHPEAGHIMMRRHEADCYAGRCPYHKDCLEGLAAGPAVEERWGAKAVSLADRKEVWEMEAFYLAQALCNYIMILAPEKIILGGGIMHQEQLFPLIREKTAEFLAGYIDTAQTHDMENYIVPASLKDNQGIMGCLELGRRAAAGCEA